MTKKASPNSDGLINWLQPSPPDTNQQIPKIWTEAASAGTVASPDYFSIGPKSL
jgi:hypothetical protein